MVLGGMLQISLSLGFYSQVQRHSMNTPSFNMASTTSSDDITAVSSLINKVMQKKGITATVELEDGDLSVILDANRVPPQQAADFIYNGVKKLEIGPAYAVRVYGRIAGQPFATWHRKFDLKPRPFGKVKTPAPSAKAQAEQHIVSIAVGSNLIQINSESSQTLGFLGVAIMVAGIFAPMARLPVVGTVSYFRDGSSEAIALFVLAAFSVFFLKKEHYSWLYGPATWSFVIISFSFYYYYDAIWQAKSSLDSELSDNPFRGLADVAMASVGLEWGWLLLFAGSILVLTAAYQKRRGLDKQAFLAIGNFLAGAALMFITALSGVLLMSRGQAAKAYESEAKTYVGSMTRAQQALYLENGSFSDEIEELGLGIFAETDRYRYNISLSEDDMVVMTAMPLEGEKLSSFTGAVFLVPENDEDYATTKAIVCQSEKPSEKPPATPTISALGDLACAPNSNEL